MSIEIIVEDGTGKTNSNSYVSIDNARSYCTVRGITLSDNDDDVAQLLILAADYISVNSVCFPGSRTVANQGMDWPRCEIRNNKVKPVETNTGLIIGPNEIPQQLVSAQLSLIAYQSNGVTLNASFSPTDYVIQETIGPITTKYSDPATVGTKQILPVYDALLNQLLSDDCSDFGGGITVRRV